MTEIIIYDLGNGPKVMWRNAQGEKFDPDTVPEEIQSHIDAIVEYVRGSKSEMQQKLETALEYIIENAPDEVKLRMISLYPEWKPDEQYGEGAEVRYENVLYRIVQPHKSQPDWTPDKVPALWRIVSLANENGELDEIEYWREPTGAHNAYKKGQKMRYLDGKVYESLIDGNNWSPVAYPAAWKEVEG